MAIHQQMSDRPDPITHSSQPRYTPELAVWELTLKCNMRCIHCGSSAGSARSRELDVEECLVVADELIELGCRQMTFIGGEVFLFPGWERVARRLSDGGVAVNIITNGFLMGDQEISQIRHAGLANVGISIDGLEENHNRIRQNDRSFSRAITAIRHLRNEGFKVGVVTSLLDFNVSDLEGMYERFLKEGVGLWQLQIATCMGNLENFDELLLKPGQVPEITRFIAEKCREERIRVYAGDDIGYFNEHEPWLRNSPRGKSSWQGCQAGLRVVGIGSGGEVKGCESLYADRFVEGNLRSETLRKIWEKKGNFAYNRQFEPGMLVGGCAGCDRGSICRGGCRGACYFTSGSLFDNRYCCYPEKRTR
jgi:radical SAM protein with 4Fe4S-binding SPASM domain